MATENNSITGRLRWHRRLGFRLAVLLTVTLLAYHFLGQYLHDGLYRLFELPTPTDVVHIVPSEEEMEEGSEQSRAAMREYAAALRGVLLNGATQAASGRWEPAEEARRTLSTVLGAQQEAFVWLDEQGRIRALSEDLPWKIGSEWPFPLESHDHIPISDEPELSAHAVYIPSEQDEAPNGTFALLHLIDATFAEINEDADDEDDNGQFHMDQQEFEALEASDKRIGHLFTILSATIAVAIASLIALVLSRLVTRRLSKLSAKVATPVGQHGELPGPFDDRGQDEIALLARSMNAMRDRVAELVDGLTRQDKRRREWVAQVSHDLRTPLTALIACLDRAEMILDKTASAPLKAALGKVLAVAKMDADRVQALSDDLFEIARLETGDALNLEPVPPGELVRQTVTGLGPMAEARGIKLQATVAPGMPILMADGRRLMRALENLLRNAIQHAHHHVEVLAELDDGSIRFEVRDDGPGFPEDNGRVALDKLSGRRSRDDSAGLGLTVTRKVAQAHGGQLDAHNRPNGGAAVWFVIPNPDTYAPNF